MADPKGKAEDEGRTTLMGTGCALRGRLPVLRRFRERHLVFRCGRREIGTNPPDEEPVPTGGVPGPRGEGVAGSGGRQVLHFVGQIFDPEHAMAMGLGLYPPSITKPPRGLTHPPPLYWLYSLLLVLGVVAFAAFYAALVAGSAYLTYLAVLFPIPINRVTLFLKAGAVAGAGMLFLFFLKGIFKIRRSDTSHMRAVTEAEQPDLFAFIRRLCREVGVAFPHRIYLSHEVNAAVFYDSSLLNLILPVRRNLEIGLGLVEALNVAEFKAVLAHEFGHFSQSGAGLIGARATGAARILYDLVFEEDGWDELVEQWRESESLFAILGWLFSGVIGLLRLLLSWVMQLLLLARLALERQQEFHADRVAVSVTGSDAIVHALCRIEFAAQAQAVAARDLFVLGQQGYFTQDLFFHQARAAEFLRRTQDPKAGVPPELPADPTARSQVFLPKVAPEWRRWLSHPSQFEREQNAKKVYLRSPQDDRPAWGLFRDPAALREEATAACYHEEMVFEGREKVLLAPEQIQPRLDALRGAPSSEDRCGGFYGPRSFGPGDFRGLANALVAQPLTPQVVAQTLDRLYSGQMGHAVEPFFVLGREREFLEKVRSGAIPCKKDQFEFRGTLRRRSVADVLLRQIEQEIEEQKQAVARLDREVFQAHLQIALATRDRGAAQELLARYEFQVALQTILNELEAALWQVGALLETLRRRGEQAAGAEAHRLEGLRQARAVFQQQRDRSAQIVLPPLDGEPFGRPLSQYLFPDSLVGDLPPGATAVEPHWENTLLEQGVRALDRGASLLPKS
ncbi:MAG: hypothetical protein FJX77_06690, partial [Armatimonadetes bacterium]|nr:hypothetical protein [Armatimonadota bacterium]